MRFQSETAFKFFRCSVNAALRTGVTDRVSVPSFLECLPENAELNAVKSCLYRQL